MMDQAESSRDLADLLAEMNQGGSGIDDLRQRTHQEAKRKRLASSGQKIPVQSSQKKRKPRPNYVEEDLRMIVRQQERQISKLKKIIAKQREEIAQIQSAASRNSGLLETGEWQSKAFKLRRRLEDIPNRRNPAKQFWMLLEVKDGIKGLHGDDEKMTLADREYAHQTKKLFDQTWSDVEAMFQEGELETLTRINQQMRKVLVVIKELEEIMESDWNPNDHVDDGPSFTQRVHKLSKYFRDLETQVKSLDSVTMNHIPRWEKIHKAKSDIIDTQLRDIFALKAAIMVAKADGRLASTETEFLIEMAENIKMGFDEAKKMILDTHGLKAHEFTGSKDEAIEVVRDAAACAFVDNVVPEAEYEMVLHIGKILDLSSEEVEQILDEED